MILRARKGFLKYVGKGNLEVLETARCDVLFINRTRPFLVKEGDKIKRDYCREFVVCGYFCKRGDFSYEVRHIPIRERRAIESKLIQIGRGTRLKRILFFDSQEGNKKLKS